MEQRKVTLKKARILAGLSLRTAARKLGVTPNTVYNYEHGRTWPDVRILARIENVYRVPYERLDFQLPKW